MLVHVRFLLLLHCANNNRQVFIGWLEEEGEGNIIHMKDWNFHQNQ